MVAHLGLHLVHFKQHGLGVRQQRGAGRGQADAARRTFQQRGLEAVLEQRDATAGGGQPDVGGLGGFCQAAQFGGPNEQCERVNVGKHGLPRVAQRE